MFKVFPNNKDDSYTDETYQTWNQSIYVKINHSNKMRKGLKNALLYRLEIRKAMYNEICALKLIRSESSWNVRDEADIKWNWAYKMTCRNI